MQNDFFKEDPLAIYEKLTDLDFCRSLVKYGSEFMSDYTKMDFTDEHVTIVKGVLLTTDRFNKKLSNDIYVGDHIFLKIWKLCASRHIVRKKESIWEELLKRKFVKDIPEHKSLFNLIYERSGKLYGWEV